MPQIDPTALVSSEAALAPDVVVGPFSIIGPDVTIGAGCVIGPHMRIEGPTTIGERNRFFGQSSIGTGPQDLKYKGERTDAHDRQRQRLPGVHHSQPRDRRRRRDHDDRLAQFHHGVRARRARLPRGVAHDLRERRHARGARRRRRLLARSARSPRSTSSAASASTPSSAAFTVATQDVLPYVKTVGNRPAKTYGINTIGLERKGFSRETIEALQKAYRILDPFEALSGGGARENRDGALGLLPRGAVSRRVRPRIEAGIRPLTAGRTRIAVVGTGYLGRLHARVLTEMPEVEHVGFLEPRDEIAAEVERALGLRRCDLARRARREDRLRRRRHDRRRARGDRDRPHRARLSTC